MRGTWKSQYPQVDMQSAMQFTPKTVAPTGGSNVGKRDLFYCWTECKLE